MTPADALPDESLSRQNHGILFQIGMTVIAAFAVMIIRHYVVMAYAIRKQVREFQDEGYPVAPGHSWFFGHLLYLKKYIDRLPPGAHYQYALGEVGRELFSGEGAFYFDLWPLAGIMIVNSSPTIAVQVLQVGKVSVNRPSMLTRFFKPIAGGPNLFDLREKEWRPWRSVFNKGFNNEHVSSLVPGMVRETLAYCIVLEKKASENQVFLLDSITLRFTMDMIGKTVLNTSLNAQQGYNTLADCMLSTIRWHQADAQTNPFSYLNFIRRYVHWSNGRQMDQYIGKLLDQRYADLISETKDAESKAMGRSVIDLVLQADAARNLSSVSSKTKLDPNFRIFAIRQIRLFLFAGHDSTSSTICYVFYLLSKHPDKLQHLRKEVSDTFGSHMSSQQIADKIVSNPNLINHLPYTTAVIKETLRLFPPASASREGFEGERIITDDGKTCNIDGLFILTLHTEVQRNPRFWKDPDSFLPERFLAKPDDPLYPPKNAYRPFEKGPRNCPAESLVMTELKVVLTIVSAGFEFRSAYSELDSLKGRNYQKMCYRGERAYQIEEGAAHPCEAMPVRVTIRNS